MSNSIVRIDLDVIDDWKVTLASINNQCIEDINELSRIVKDFDNFKGHTADVARELITDILQSANKAHENLDSAQKTLTNIQEVKSNA
ncbi:MAG TPA: hypothetical protein IAC02_01020 [Candidatus Coprovivens excrementavium]|nr:hypothetical protein [Candidatus Coprovivens excrementavium]